MQQKPPNRWLRFILLGLAFGILDWYFLDLLASLGRNEALNAGLQQASDLVRLVGVGVLLGLNFGIWFMPVIPATNYTNS